MAVVNAKKKQFYLTAALIKMIYAFAWAVRKTVNVTSISTIVFVWTVLRTVGVVIL